MMVLLKVVPIIQYGRAAERDSSSNPFKKSKKTPIGTSPPGRSKNAPLALANSWRIRFR